MNSLKTGFCFVLLVICLPSIIAHWADWELCEDDWGNVKAPLNLEGSCPNITICKNFDIKYLQGQQFVIFTTNDHTKDGCTGGCLTNFVAQLDGDCYRQSSCCQKGCGNVCGTSIGSGILEPCEGGVKFIVDGKETIFYVLESDKFKNYAVLYSCSSPVNGKIIEKIRVLSRYPTLDWVTRNHILHLLRFTDVDCSRLIDVSQREDCPYNFFNN